MPAWERILPISVPEQKKKMNTDFLIAIDTEKDKVLFYNIQRRKVLSFANVSANTQGQWPVDCVEPCCQTRRSQHCENTAGERFASQCG